jgi:hypothetical protein
MKNTVLQGQDAGIFYCELCIVSSFGGAAPHHVTAGWEEERNDGLSSPSLAPRLRDIPGPGTMVMGSHVSCASKHERDKRALKEGKI